MHHGLLGAIALTTIGIGVGCSTVDESPSGGGASFGTLNCYYSPGAAAYDPEEEEYKYLILANEFPKYCWCQEDENSVSAEKLEELKSSAIAECLWTAGYLGLDKEQTNCEDVIEGPTSDGSTCPLYGGGKFQEFGDDGGDTGGQQTSSAELQLTAYRPIADATASLIDWSNGGIPEYVPLGCDLNVDCCESFETGICTYTDPEYPMPGSRAEWSVSDPTTAIEIAVVGCVAGSDPELMLEGRADYSVSTCGDARCPVYIGSLKLELPAGNSGQFSTALFDGYCADKTVERFELRLVHAGVGSRDPLTDRVAFPVGSLVFQTSVDISASPGDFGAGEYNFLAFNDRVVWGYASGDGSLRFDPSSLSFQELGFDLSVSFEASLVGSPPEVDVDLPPSLECEGDGTASLPLSGTVSDVDADLLTAYWLLDGDVIPESILQLPVGLHNLAYRAVDERGASSVQRNCSAPEKVDVIDLATEGIDTWRLS